MKWTLRSAVAEDAGKLAAIDAAASAHPWLESQFITACSTSPGPGVNSFLESVQLLEVDGEIRGFVVYSLVVDEGSVFNIAVSPSSQGLGYARILLQAVLDILGCCGARRCLLEVRASNAAARGLYGSFEFQVDGVRKNYYPSHNGREDALLMSKSLLLL